MDANSTRNRKRILQESLKASRPENTVHPEERLLPAEFREKLRKTAWLVVLFHFSSVRTPAIRPVTLSETRADGDKPMEAEAVEVVALRELI